MSPVQKSTPGSTASYLFLLYHELRSTPSTYSYVTQTALFAEHIRLFQAARPADSFHPQVTFDDGHLSNLTEALPILLDNNLAAHFFITAGWTGTKAGYMEARHLRQLHAAGQQIGAHGLTHKLLTHCSVAELDQELRVAKLTLEDTLGAPVTTMSLPGGRSSPAILKACEQAGFLHVFTSTPRPETMPFARSVGRLNLLGDTTVSWLEKLLDPATGTLLSLQRADRMKSTAKRLLGDSLYRRLWSLVNREEPPAPSENGLQS